ncbi:MAG TPA: DoxX family protein [Burkholderiales bacterium]|jgi:putative oxidoreductase|nr:DoxX family protein [Burkholderiales bacterium]
MEDSGKLILRLALGVMILLHGVAKLTGGPTAIIGLVTKAGLPGELAFLVYVGEIIAPILVIAGVLTRPAAMIIAVNMAVAVYLVHMRELLVLSKSGGWALELQGMFFFVALGIALVGAGRFSLAGNSGRWN